MTEPPGNHLQGRCRRPQVRGDGARLVGIREKQLLAMIQAMLYDLCHLDLYLIAGVIFRGSVNKGKGS